MSYTPTTWTTGDTITASAMNKIEQGIADGGGGAVIITDNDGTLDKTYAEIYDLINSGTPCYIRYGDNTESIVESTDLDDEYYYGIQFMSIVTIYKYDATYRIIASAAIVTNLNDYVQGSPAIWTYQASSSQAYPTFLRKAYASNRTSDNGHYLGV